MAAAVVNSPTLESTKDRVGHPERQGIAVARPSWCPEAKPQAGTAGSREI